jgi:hypothetical protein
MTTTVSPEPEPGAPLCALRCPSCGEANGCVPAATGTFDPPCWCAGIVVDRGAVARVPAALQRKACLCPRCATLDHGRQVRREGQDR